MSAIVNALTDLKRQRPEWGPWLAVVEETLREADGPAWDAAVPTGAQTPQLTAPLLAGTVIAMEGRAVRNLLRRLIRVASRRGTPEMATLSRVRDAEADALTLFRASLRQDSLTVTDAARSCGADPGALEAVIALVAVPFLHACNRGWARNVSPGWLQGYCPVCGSWPAFAEARGIERNRFYRCGRCGSEWHARPLRCPYCGMDDHTALVSLVPERGEMNGGFEGCRACLAYVKTFTRLQGCPPGAVMLEDLASVALDIAALEQGYVRPRGAGYPLDVSVTARNVPRRFFAWDA